MCACLFTLACILASVCVHADVRINVCAYMGGEFFCYQVPETIVQAERTRLISQDSVWYVFGDKLNKPDGLPVFFTRSASGLSIHQSLCSLCFQHALLLLISRAALSPRLIC